MRTGQKVLLVVAFGFFSFYSQLSQELYAGTLYGSVGTPDEGTIVDLTSQGTIDWSHWGSSGYEHKMGVGGVAAGYISDFIQLKPGQLYSYTDNAIGFSWTDGVWETSSTNNLTGIYLAGPNQGFKFTVLADQQQRELKIYTATSNCQANILAKISDDSALSYANRYSEISNERENFVYTIHYQAETPNSFLTITVLSFGTNTESHCSLQAVTLSEIVPEPCSLALLAGGAVVMALKRRRK